MMVIVGHDALMVSGMTALAAQPFASVAVTVKLNVPGAVGVPESTPAVDKAMPGGSAPEDQVTGKVPPVCVKLNAGYTVPTVPTVGVPLMVIVGQDAARIVSATVLLAVQPFASDTVTVTLNVPGVVGVPESTPTPDSVMPGGNAPDDQVTGDVPPDWVKLYAG